jgi:fission process protein 1
MLRSITLGVAKSTQPLVSLARPMIRYSGYASDFGESFRPLAKPWVVKSLYCVSWIYVCGDVGYTTYHYHREGVQGHDLYRVFIERSVFQALATMLLPAITIHEIVRITNKKMFFEGSKFMSLNFMRNHKWALRYGGTICGLSIVPFLPFMYDVPVKFLCQNFFNFTMPWKNETTSNVSPKN